MTDEGPAPPSPDDAFALLGNESRVEILRVLGDADGAVPFSELNDRVGMSDSGQFNYHLDKLVGHFVRKTDEGYELRRAGERVVEAVLSGAVTDAPVLEPTEVDHPCPLCGAPVEVTFREERVELYCTECPGNFEGSDSPEGSGGERSYGYLGYHPLPPAGVSGRSADGVLRAAATWGRLELMAAASDVCPRCSAALDRELAVCDDHDASDGLCDACGNRRAVTVDMACTNCIYDARGAAAVALTSATPLLAFLTTHGYNPVTPTPADHPTVDRVFSNYEETVVSRDPLEVRLDFALDGDALSITVDEDLTVLAVEES